MNDCKKNEAHTHNTNKKIGEKDMMNNTTYRFNGLDAQTIADRIIDRDRRLAEVDFASLSFDEKCRYVADIRIGEYPGLEHLHERVDTTELVAKLTERAEAGDSIAAYYLLGYRDYRSVSTERRGEILRAAAEAGDLGAVKAYFGHKRRGGYDEADYDLACAVIESLADAQPSIQASRAIIACYGVLRSFWHGRENVCDKIIEAEREKLLGWGHYMSVVSRSLSLNGLIRRAASAAEREAYEDEQRFWRTALYIVSDYYQRIIGRWWNIRLAERVIGGRGCEVDYERAADLFLGALHYACEGTLSDELVRVADGCTEEEAEIARYLRLLAAGDDATLRALIRDDAEDRLCATARKTYGVLRDVKYGYR